MFGWFKKNKKDPDAELRTRLAEKVSKYETNRADITDTTWTDVEIDGRIIRIPKHHAKAVEELDEAVFVVKDPGRTTVNNIPRKNWLTQRDVVGVDSDPWSQVKKR